MPLQIRERPPKKYNVVKPRGTEREAQKRTAGSVKPETINSAAKTARQQGRDIGGRSGWKAPSEGRSNPQIAESMNKNYEDYFFTIPRGHTRGSVGPHKRMSKKINSAHYFR